MSVVTDLRGTDSVTTAATASAMTAATASAITAATASAMTAATASAMTAALPPKRVFVVPYRNRVQHKFFFSKYMSFILEDADDYEIVFSHQCDARTFNRGAVKNIGFLAMKQKYPEHYLDMTFIFNDVDTIPFAKIFEYDTVPGVVKHYYGFTYALGGIVVMKGRDFERTNGFPCFWGWGMEDNVLQTRCERVGLRIDRSVFYKIGSPEILQLFDGITRIISKKDPWRGEHDDFVDGLQTIRGLKFTLDATSSNPTDNVFTVHNNRIRVLNIATFLTHIPFGAEEYYQYDLREPKRKIINPDKLKETAKTVIRTSDWSNIPHYPTTREKRENVAAYLQQMGKPVPLALQQQIQRDKQLDIAEDVFNAHMVQAPAAHTTMQPPSHTMQQQPAHVPPRPPLQLRPQLRPQLQTPPRKMGAGAAYVVHAPNAVPPAPAYLPSGAAWMFPNNRRRR